MEADVIFENHAPELRKAMLKMLDGALEECGIEAERNAKIIYCPVDTGRLKNSITHAVGGQPAAISTYRGDRKGKKGKGDTKPPGVYSGTAPKDDDEERSVWVGTNVEYGRAIELGTSKITARPYIRPSIENHLSKYEEIFDDWVKQIEESFGS